MKNEIVSIFSILLIITTGTLQDGFNFYKALNRTPVSRVERFYSEAWNRPFRIPLPLTKRLLYAGSINDNKESIIHRKNKEIIPILMKWFPSTFEASDVEMNERKQNKCIDIQNLLFSLDNREPTS